jgi:hypothetical protein
MPLTYDYTDIRDYETLHESGSERVITETILFCMMPLQVGVITEANARLFHLGIQVLEMDGALMRGPADEAGKNRPYYISVADVERRIGMVSNTGTGRVQDIARNIRRIMSEKIKEAK